jgi:hypothetical protein
MRFVVYSVRPRMTMQNSFYAAIIACMIVFLLGLGHYALEAHSGRVRNQQLPVDFSALARLPCEIGDWIGQDSLLDERTVKISRVDAYISRYYSQAKDKHTVILYIGCGNDPALVTHYPDRCYLGSGWIPVGRNKGEIAQSNGTITPYNIYKYTREDFEGTEMTLFQFFVADGHCYRDTSKIEQHNWGQLRPVRYYAQVQIGIQSKWATIETSEEVLHGFAVNLLPYMNRMFEELLEESETVLNGNDVAEKQD